MYGQFNFNIWIEIFIYMLLKYVITGGTLLGCFNNFKITQCLVNNSESIYFIYLICV